MINWEQYKNESTEVLIDFFQDSTKVENIHDSVFLALMFRFRGDMLKATERVCKNRGYDVDVAKEILERTFKKYGKSKKFKIEEGKSTNIDKCFKAYLYKIATNELNNYYHEQVKRQRGQYYDGTECIVTEPPNINRELLSIEDQIVHDTLIEFPHSHQVVFLTYKMHEKEGVNLPKKLRIALRNYLGGVEQTTIRGYKKEVIDKIENAKKIINKLNHENGQ